MLAQAATARERLAPVEGLAASPARADPTPRLRAARTFAFTCTFGLLLAYALRGGAYDVVTRQEYGLVIWWLLAVGIALGLLPRARPSPALLLLLGSLLAYAAWTALSLTWSESSERTTSELARVLDYTGLVALLGCALDRRTWRSAAAGLGFAALAVCALAVASRLAPSAFPTNEVRGAFATDRLSYPFGYWNAVAAWGAMSASIGLAWSAHDRSRVRRALALALVPVACLTTYLTYSRAGIGGIALALVAVLLGSRNRLTVLIHAAVAAIGVLIAILAVHSASDIAHGNGAKGASSVLAALLFAAVLCAAVSLLTLGTSTDNVRLPRSIARPLGASALAVLFIAAAVFGPHLASQAWHGFRHPAVAPTSNPTARLTNLSGTRYEIWTVAVHAFDHAPATGTGAGTFEFWWNRHQTNGEFVRNTHSLWLQNMAELGLPGLLLIVTVMGAAIALAAIVRRRSRRSASAGASTALLAALVVYLLHASVDWMWESTAVTVLALAAVAILGARLGRRAKTMRWIWRLPLVAAALAAAALQVPGLLSTVEITRSQQAERAGNTNRALSWARDAVEAEPWSASAYVQRGLVQESAGRLGSAALDIKHAISVERTNFAAWVVLARIETERGLYPAALRDYNQARRLRPQASVFENVS